MKGGRIVLLPTVVKTFARALAHTDISVIHGNSNFLTCLLKYVFYLPEFHTRRI